MTLAASLADQEERSESDDKALAGVLDTLRERVARTLDKLSIEDCHGGVELFSPHLRTSLRDNDYSPANMALK